MAGVPYAVEITPRMHFCSTAADSRIRLEGEHRICLCQHAPEYSNFSQACVGLTCMPPHSSMEHHANPPYFAVTQYLSGDS